MSSESPFLLDSSAQERFMLLREAAVSAATEACMQQFPQTMVRFGAAGRQACAEDIGFHLDFLLVTLETGDLSPFTAYLGWLSQVLSSRSVPADSIPFSLEALERFFRSHLPGEAGDRVCAALALGCKTLLAGIDPPSYDSGLPDAWAQSEPYMTAALAGDRRAAGRAFESALERGPSVVEPEVHVIQPALYGVGRAWQRNEVSVAQEHVATALSLTLMAQAIARAEWADDCGMRVVLACCAGNHHSVGLRMVADAFELGGWDTVYLGGNTPAPALVDLVRAGPPNLIALSASLPQQLRNLRATVATLRRQLGEACPLIAVGGLVFNQFPLLAGSVDALYLGSNALEARRRADEIVLPGGVPNPS